jgi:hypothetical protein
VRPAAEKTTTRKASRNDSVSDRSFASYPLELFMFLEGVYKETTMPVIKRYKKLHKIAEIDSGPSVDKVYEHSAKVVRELLAGKLSGNVTA